MKVIGQAPDSCIVEMTSSELEMLSGRSASEFYNRAFPVGAEFKIVETWRKLRDLERRKDAVGQASASLIGLAQTLDMLLKPIVKHALEPEPEGGEA